MTETASLTRLLDSAAALANEDLAAALADVAMAMAPNTRRAYTSDLADFADYCKSHDREWSDPTAIAAYLRTLHGHGAALETIKRRTAAIHKLWELHVLVTDDETQWDPTKHPVVKNAIKAIRADVGTDTDQAPPLTADLLIETLVAIDADTLAGKRDTAMLLLGWCGALRRSELAAIRRSHLEIDTNGIVIALPHTKGRDHTEYVPIAAQPNSRWDPLAHLQGWLQALDTELAGDIVWARITRTSAAGTIYQPAAAVGADAINRTVKRRAKMAGIDRASEYSAHSLRAGFVTEAKNRRIDEADIMAHTRHKSVTVMRTYDRTTGFWYRNASAELPL